MKFMLMMNVPRGTGDYQINQWTPEAFNAAHPVHEGSESGSR